MLQVRSRVDVADNTGAKMAKMIGVIGKRTLVANVGDVITAHIREASTGGSVKKGDVVRAVVVRTRHAIRREDGGYLRSRPECDCHHRQGYEPEGDSYFRPCRSRTP